MSLYILPTWLCTIVGGCGHAYAASFSMVHIWVRMWLHERWVPCLSHRLLRVQGDAILRGLSDDAEVRRCRFMAWEVGQFPSVGLIPAEGGGILPQCQLQASASPTLTIMPCAVAIDIASRDNMPIFFMYHASACSKLPGLSCHCCWCGPHHHHNSLSCQNIH